MPRRRSMALLGRRPYEAHEVVPEQDCGQRLEAAKKRNVELAKEVGELQFRAEEAEKQVAVVKRFVPKELLAVLDKIGKFGIEANDRTGSYREGVEYYRDHFLQHVATELKKCYDSKSTLPENKKAAFETLDGVHNSIEGILKGTLPAPSTFQDGYRDGVNIGFPLVQMLINCTSEAAVRGNYEEMIARLSKDRVALQQNLQECQMHGQALNTAHEGLKAACLELGAKNEQLAARMRELEQQSGVCDTNLKDCHDAVDFIKEESNKHALSTEELTGTQAGRLAQWYNRIMSTSEAEKKASAKMSGVV